MSARITHLLTDSDCETLRTEMLAKAIQTTGPACEAWLDAVILLDKHRSASFQRRAKATPSARRKSLGTLTPSGLKSQVSSLKSQVSSLL